MAGDVRNFKEPELNNNEIANLLCDYRDAKNEVKELRTEMVRLAVDQLGLDQQAAMKRDLETFLDGYLVGQGVMQSWRHIGEVQA